MLHIDAHTLEYKYYQGVNDNVCSLYLQMNDTRSVRLVNCVDNCCVQTLSRQAPPETYVMSRDRSSREPAGTKYVPEAIAVCLTFVTFNVSAEAL